LLRKLAASNVGFSSSTIKIPIRHTVFIPEFAGQPPLARRQLENGVLAMNEDLTNGA
jgi:hypothetical protein